MLIFTLAFCVCPEKHLYGFCDSDTERLESIRRRLGECPIIFRDAFPALALIAVFDLFGLPFGLFRPPQVFFTLARHVLPPGWDENAKTGFQFLSNLLNGGGEEVPCCLEGSLHLGC